ncbi:hypothetical protein KBD71_04465 [Candidatus Woesebacteria bacterium]|nr:hypothetical protein [Candidatus Woesebacteria bacterium]
MSEIKRIGVLKRARLGDDLARELNAEDPTLEFVALPDEQSAVDALNRGFVDLIVSGVVGIEWEDVFRQVGNNRIIVYSTEVTDEELDTMRKAGISFVQQAFRESIENLIVVIRSKVSRE